MAEEKKEKADNEEKSPYSFSVHNVYVKDVSFEAPNTPQIFSIEWDPKVEFDLEMSSSKITEGLWESVLDVTVKVNLKIDEKKQAEHAGKDSEIAFLVEVKLAGVFTIAGFDKEHTDRILSTTVPSILFPYVRETVSGLVSKGGFPQLVLPPMNFEAMYQQHLEEEKQKVAANQDSKK